MKMWIFLKYVCHAMFCSYDYLLLGSANWVTSNLDPSRAANPTRTSVHMREPWANIGVGRSSVRHGMLPHSRFTSISDMVFKLCDCAIKFYERKGFSDSSLFKQNPVITQIWLTNKIKLIFDQVLSPACFFSNVQVERGRGGEGVRKRLLIST